MDNERLVMGGSWPFSWFPHVHWPGLVLDSVPGLRHPNETGNALFADAHAANIKEIATDTTSEFPHWSRK